MMHKHSNRRGAVLIALMAFLAIASMLIVSWIKLAGMEQRKLRSIHATAQASWLAEAGLSRAASKVAADPNYTGETWTLTPADLDNRDGAVVEIQVKPSTQSDGTKELSVQADFPADPIRRQRVSKSILMTFP